jgi:hypothetical protein
LFFRLIRPAGTIARRPARHDHAIERSNAGWVIDAREQRGFVKF